MTLESSEADNETDDEISCDICEHRSQTKGGLKIHMGKKHKETPQLDDDMQTERETDDWWENNSVVSFKMLKVFGNLIEDIKESKLTGEEKSIEQERGIEARVKGCDNENEVLKMIRLNRLKRSESLIA